MQQPPMFPCVSKLSAYGAEIPAIGFGTSALAGNAAEIVTAALKRPAGRIANPAGRVSAWD